MREITNILTEKDILDKKMTWGDIVRYHIPTADSLEIENAYNWSYNRSASIEKTLNPKNYVILNAFQNEYLNL